MEKQNLILFGFVEILRGFDRFGVIGIVIGPSRIIVYSAADLELHERVTLIFHFGDRQIGNVSETIQPTFKSVKLFENKYQIGFQFDLLDLNNNILLNAYIESQKEKEVFH